LANGDFQDRDGHRCILRGKFAGPHYLVLPVVLFIATVIVGYVAPTIATAVQDPAAKAVSPSAKSSLAEQPIPFSHKLHLSFDMKCQECHPNPEPGDRMTLPVASKCMECHRTIAKDKPSIQKLAEFSQSKQAIPWVRVYVVSGWVFWNHRAHLEAGMKCEMCHGDVSKMEVLKSATNVTSMAGCVDCHRKNNASTGCQYCHSGK
jgi:hypothetical protein